MQKFFHQTPLVRDCRPDVRTGIAEGSRALFAFSWSVFPSDGNVWSTRLRSNPENPDLQYDRIMLQGQIFTFYAGYPTIMNEFQLGGNMQLIVLNFDGRAGANAVISRVLMLACLLRGNYAFG